MGAKLAGGGGGKRGELPVNSDPNVIPFIDVMLVLLIIFMVASPIASVDIQVDMPESKTLPSKRPPKPTWVTLTDRDGVVQAFVMNEKTPVAFENLGDAVFREVNVNTPQAEGDQDIILNERVYIRAQSTTKYKNVMLVMNRLQDRGFTKIALVAEDTRR